MPTGPPIIDAELGAAPRDVRGVGARDQRLGRHAAGVDAGAAEQLALDQRDRHAGGGQPAGERRPGLAGADDDRVEGAASSQRRHDQQARRRSRRRPRSMRPAGRGRRRRQARPDGRSAQRADDRADDARRRARRPAIAAASADRRAAQPAGDDPRAELHRHLAAGRRWELVGDQFADGEQLRIQGVKR